MSNVTGAAIMGHHFVGQFWRMCCTPIIWCDSWTVTPLSTLLVKTPDVNSDGEGWHMTTLQKSALNFVNMPLHVVTCQHNDMDQTVS